MENWLLTAIFSNSLLPLQPGVEREQGHSEGAESPHPPALQQAAAGRLANCRAGAQQVSGKPRAAQAQALHRHRFRAVQDSLGCGGHSP